MTDDHTDCDQVREQLERIGDNALEVDRLRAQLYTARMLLTSDRLGRYCGYNYKETSCPMTTPCWHHRRNAFLAAPQPLMEKPPHG